MNSIGAAVPDDYEPPMEGGGGTAFSPQRLLRILLRGAPLIVFSVILGVTLGAIALKNLTPKYTSSASLLIDPKRPGAVGEEAQFANLYVDESKVASVEEILVSDGLLRKVVQAEHLSVDPAYVGKSVSRLPPWLGFLSRSQPMGYRDTAEARDERALETLAKSIRTARVGITYVITITVTAPSADRAQSLARAVAEAYLDDQLDTKQEAARRDNAWLAARLQQQQQELVASEQDVEAIRQKYGLTQTDNSRATLDQQAVADINGELIRAEADVASAGATYQQGLHALHGGSDLESLPSVAGSKTLDDLRKQQTDTERLVAELSSQHSSNYPPLQQAQQTRDAVNAQLALAASRVVGGLRQDYEAALAHSDALKRQLAEHVAATSDARTSAGRIKLQQAQGVAQGNRAAYEVSLNQLRALEQQQTHETVEARILSDPKRPDAPSFPKPVLLYAGGGIAGLALGFILVFMVGLARRQVFESPEDEGALPVPVLAAAPLLRKRDLYAGTVPLTITDFLISNPFSAFSESLKLLRLGLRGFGRKGGQVVLFTSAVPGEGKSTIAAAMAISAAAGGVRTLIVDFDLHNPSLGSLSEDQPEAGVVDILLGAASVDASLKVYKDLPLRIIRAGSVNKLRAGLIEGHGLRELMRELRDKFDLIILDTPPVLAISDPLFLAGAADVVVLVAAWRSTPVHSVLAAISALRSARAPIAGVVMNKVEDSRNAAYGYHKYQYPAHAKAWPAADTLKLLQSADPPTR